MPVKNLKMFVQKRRIKMNIIIFITSLALAIAVTYQSMQIKRLRKQTLEALIYLGRKLPK